MSGNSFDIGRARADTPGCAHVAHFNNAGASLQPLSVLDAVMSHLGLEARIGGYEAADAAAERADAVYESLGMLIGAAPSEVAILDSASRAWQAALGAVGLGAGDRVLCSENEFLGHHLGLLREAERSGALVEVIPSDEHGQISLSALGGMLDERVALVALIQVPSNNGLVNPVAEACAMARAAGAISIVDGCQAVGQLPIDVLEIGCDVFTATGRKYLRAPRGTGFLYVRSESLDRLRPASVDWRSATLIGPGTYDFAAGSQRFETWERNVGAVLGLGAAADYALGWGLDTISMRIASLAQSLRSGLAAIAGVTVHDRGLRTCGIVTFSVAGPSAELIFAAAAARRINVRVAVPEQSPLDPAGNAVGPVVRASVHYYNNEDDLDRLIALVEAMARGANS